jgi:hypothetical protein
MRPFVHQAGGHVVAEHRGGNVVGHQLPCGQPRALQKGPRFVGEDVNALALLDGRADDAQSGSVAAGGQSPGVAMRQHAAFVGHQRRAESSHRLAGGNVFLVHRVRLGQDLFLDLV